VFGALVSLDDRLSKDGRVLGARESLGGRVSIDGRSEVLEPLVSLGGRLLKVDRSGVPKPLESLGRRLSKDGRSGVLELLEPLDGVLVRRMGLGGGCGEYGSLRPVESVRSRSVKDVEGSLLESEAVLGRGTFMRLGPPLSDKGLGTRF
jgi:hypothetical protein